MLEWLEPEIKYGSRVREITCKAGCMGSDCSFANIYLLRNKYHTQMSFFKDFLIRRYSGMGARLGYTFPIGEGDVGKAVSEIEQDAACRKEKVRWAFVTEEQKSILEQLRPGKYMFSTDCADSDYVYLQSELAALSGRAFHKKKNHVSRFLRLHEDGRYEEIGCNNWDDARYVADCWYEKRTDKSDKSLDMEYEAIREALNYMNELELSGGIIYVNNVPVAMTVASLISDGVCDIHFEKVIEEYANDGGYAYINNMFAKRLSGVEYINREEDMGIEGLRKAKESYRPRIMLKKYSGIEV